MSGLTPVTLSDVHAASRRIWPHLPTTPMVYSAARSSWLKLESFQKTGAYKVRGALNALFCQVERGDRRPVIAASAGNHGAGVAWAARHLGLQARVVVPHGAPRVKTRVIRSLGADVIHFGDQFDDSYEHALQLARRHGWRFLHAFDDPDVIAGQGTVGLEIQTMNPEMVLVPIGGGGLASGISLVTRAAGIRLVGVQVAGVNAMSRALRGDVRPHFTPMTIADGLQVRAPGQLTLEICRQGLDDIIEVSEWEVRRAMRALVVEDGLRVEGAGAVAVAGLAHVVGTRAVAVVSGGNVDTPQLLEVLRTPRCPPGQTSSDLVPNSIAV